MIEYILAILLVFLSASVLMIPVVLVFFVINKTLSKHNEVIEQKRENEYAIVFELEKELIKYNTKICKLKHKKINRLEIEIKDSRNKLSTSLPEEKEELYKIIRTDLKLLIDLEENSLEPLASQKRILEQQIEGLISKIENKNSKKYLEERYHTKKDAINIEEFEKTI